MAAYIELQLNPKTPNTKHQTPNTKHQTPNTKHNHNDDPQPSPEGEGATCHTIKKITISPHTPPLTPNRELCKDLKMRLRYQIYICRRKHLVAMKNDQASQFKRLYHFCKNEQSSRDRATFMKTSRVWEIAPLFIKTCTV